MGLHVRHDVALQVVEDCHADVHLVVHPVDQAHHDVVAHVLPVQVVPETLGQPVLADLVREHATVIKHCNSASADNLC